MGILHFFNLSLTSAIFRSLLCRHSFWVTSICVTMSLYCLFYFVIVIPYRPNTTRREKNELNFYEGLHKTFWGTTKKCENKNLTFFKKILFQYNSQKCTGQEGLTCIIFWFALPWKKSNRHNENNNKQHEIKINKKSKEKENWKIIIIIIIKWRKETLLKLKWKKNHTWLSDRTSNYGIYLCEYLKI